MQLDRGITGTTAAEAHPPKDLEAAFVAIDNHSWVDAFVAPRNAALMEVSDRSIFASALAHNPDM